MSQILTVKSPEAEPRTFSAAGLKATWPTFLGLVRTYGVCALTLAHFGCPLNFPTGAISWISSAVTSGRIVKPSGTRHRKTREC